MQCFVFSGAVFFFALAVFQSTLPASWGVPPFQLHPGGSDLCDSPHPLMQNIFGGKKNFCIL